MASAGKSESSYLHGVDPAEQHRLEVLAKILGGADFLPALHPGMRVLEVGCGTGAIAREVACRVAPGEVIGIDREEAQLQTARQLAKQHNVDNVRFLRGDAARTGLEDADVDAAYCRFLLEHVDDPVEVLVEMRRVVKPGGWVCAYEWENSCGAIHPDSPAVDQVWQGIYELQSRQGGEAWIARKLYGLFRRAGLSQVRAEGRAWTINADERQKLEAYVQGAREIISQTREGLLSENLVTADVLTQADEEYGRLLGSTEAYVFEGFCRALGTTTAGSLLKKE